ncbi:MAG: sugar ABC transporter permease [Firmicutes bacterium]|nr:sugar ABC transporter permease [Bacillota bacterium]
MFNKYVNNIASNKYVNNKAAEGPLIKVQSALSWLCRNIARDKYLILLVLFPVIYFIVFHYIPMYGVIIAFKDFSPSKGILGSPWVGLRWFYEFFNSNYAFRLIRNVLLLNLYNLVWGFPIPIMFALLLNELKNGLFKRIVQTVSYLPHFISVVVIVGMVVIFLSPYGGIINVIIEKLGYKSINFMSKPEWFRTIYIATGIWQEFGWNSIIYLAALSSIDPQLYEAAKIDGASRWKQVIHITLPGLAPTIIILFILQVGRMMKVGFEKIILMYNPATYEVSDVISPYVYRVGLLGGEFSFASAVDLFNSVINFILLVSVNKLSKKLTDIALW